MIFTCRITSALSVAIEYASTESLTMRASVCARHGACSTMIGLTSSLDVVLIAHRLPTAPGATRLAAWGYVRARGWWLHRHGGGSSLRDGGASLWPLGGTRRIKITDGEEVDALDASRRRHLATPNPLAHRVPLQEMPIRIVRGIDELILCIVKISATNHCRSISVRVWIGVAGIGRLSPCRVRGWRISGLCGRA